MELVRSLKLPIAIITIVSLLISAVATTVANLNYYENKIVRLEIAQSDTANTVHRIEDYILNNKLSCTITADE